MLLLTEKQIAIAAVRRACALTSLVFNQLRQNETLTKDDESPVTVGDFGSQAVINTVLRHAFPDDPIVGEEDSAELRSDSTEAVRHRIVELVNRILTAPLQPGENEQWGFGPERGLSTDEVMDMIDRGNYNGGSTGRLWTLDPIDGTKGFLHGGQYAVCLALIIDSVVHLGVVGCPNLPLSASNPSGPRGCIFVAVKDQGAFQFPLDDPFNSETAVPLHLPAMSTPENSCILQSVGHTRLTVNDRVAQLLGWTMPPISMDSQAKYCSLSRGEGGVYLRLAGDLGYRENIWDHAPSAILIEEAGGVITDADGEPLNFALENNYGIIAAGKDVHSRVLKAVKQVRAEGK